MIDILRVFLILVMLGTGRLAYACVMSIENDDGTPDRLCAFAMAAAGLMFFGILHWYDSAAISGVVALAVSLRR